MDNVGDSPSARFTPTYGPPRARTLSTAQTRRMRQRLFVCVGMPYSLCTEAREASHGYHMAVSGDAFPTRLRRPNDAAVQRAAQLTWAILRLCFASVLVADLSATLHLEPQHLALCLLLCLTSRVLYAQKSICPSCLRASFLQQCVGSPPASVLYPDCHPWSAWSLIQRQR